MKCIGLFGISFSPSNPMLTNHGGVFNQMISGVFKCNTRFNDGCFLFHANFGRRAQILIANVLESGSLCLFFGK